MSTGIMVALAALAVMIVLPRLLGGPRIKGPEAREKVAAGATLVDVRSPGEFSSGHIKGALNIPHTDVGRRARRRFAHRAGVVARCGVPHL